MHPRKAVVTRLTREVEAVLGMPDLIASMSKQGADPTYLDPAAFGAYIRAELKRWETAVKSAALKPGTF